jgi:hypothetical protein
MFFADESSRLPDDPQLCEVEHDLLFTVELELDGGYRIMRTAFHSDDFAESEFLMLYFLSDLQARSIAGYKVG